MLNSCVIFKQKMQKYHSEVVSLLVVVWLKVMEAQPLFVQNVNRSKPMNVAEKFTVWHSKFTLGMWTFKWEHKFGIGYRRQCTGSVTLRYYSFLVVALFMFYSSRGVISLQFVVFIWALLSPPIMIPSSIWLKHRVLDHPVHLFPLNCKSNALVFFCYPFSLYWFSHNCIKLFIPNHCTKNF